MDYLRRYAIKLQSNVPIYLTLNMLMTYSEIAHCILSGIILGILCAYSSHYVLLDTSLYCIWGAVGYLLYTLVKSGVRYRLQSFLSVTYIVVTGIVSCLLGGISYVHVNHQINEYVGHTKFFLSQEGEYALLIDSPVDLKIIDGKEYKSFSAVLLGLVPHKDTAKGVHIKADGHIRVTIQENSTHLHMGDSIIIYGTPKSLYLTEERGTIDKRNKAIRNEDMGTIFDGTYKVVDLHVLEQYKIDSYIGYYQRWLHIIDSMRSTVEVLMQQYLSDTTKWLGTALVLGGHYGELGQDVLRQFGYTGIIHILSISGSHIALLFSIVYGICRLGRIRKRYAMIGGIIVSIFYCIVVGFSAPVVRSTIMGIWLALAYLKGRMYTAKQGLAVTAILFLLYDPLLILDVSFQLSFGATYGLLIWGKVLYERIQWLPKWIKTPLVLCVSAQLLILPLQLYYFHYISIASLLAACIVAPILDISIILIFISTVISYVMSISFLWSLIDALLRILLYLNHVLGRSGSLLWLGMMHLCCVYVYYTLLGLFTYFLTHKKEYTVYVVMSLLCMVAAYGVSYYVTHHHKNTLIHYIPMKQCNVLLCIAPNHEQAYLLIDAPDYIKTIPNERQINQTIRAYGMNPRMVKVKYFHSNGSARVIYKNGMNQIVVYNGQSREKNLKLNDKANVLFITSRFSVMHEIDRISPRSTVLFSSPHGALRDVDPSSEHMYIMGYSFIKDIYL